MSVQHVLRRYEDLKFGYRRVDELREQAGDSPDLQTEADEIEADLNEATHALMDELVTVLETPTAATITAYSIVDHPGMVVVNVDGRECLIAFAGAEKLERSLKLARKYRIAMPLAATAGPGQLAAHSMTSDEYLDAIHELGVVSGRGHDIANLLVGFTASKLSGEDRRNAVETARGIFAMDVTP